MSEGKQWYKSKTIIIAIITGISGIVVAFESTYPGIGLIIIVKAVLDIALRYVTTNPIK